MIPTAVGGYLVESSTRTLALTLANEAEDNSRN
jgi:hypothetical protein